MAPPASPDAAAARAARDVLFNVSEADAMEDTVAEGLFDPQKGLPEPDSQDRGDVSHGTERDTPTASEGDSPNRGSVEGPLAPQPLPGGMEADHGEMRPKQNDSRTSDGVGTFKRMESDAERRQQN